MKPALLDALAAQGWNVRSAQPLSGGMINQAARLETDDGPLFIKWNEQAPYGLFEAEAEGLRALAATQTIRVPQVLHTAPASPQTPAFLALEWIETAPPVDQVKMTRRFAEELAAVHQAPAPSTFGWINNNFLGELVQINNFTASWPRFYNDCRLQSQIALAREKGLLPSSRERLLDMVVNNLEVLLADFEPRACLIHGDLWCGNFITTAQQTVLIDPAVYYGEREMELAFIELFGGFPSGFVDAYRQVFPLQKGYERRRPLHQLYPLLVHLNHFGETYGTRLEGACRQLLETP
jgi:fructosamine-3-kinase